MTTRTEILQLKLEVDGDGQVKASLAGVEQSLHGAERGAGGLGSQFNALKGAVAALGLGYLAKQFLDLTASMDATAKSAALLQTTTERVTEMQAAFRAAGADGSNLERILRQMSSRTADAAHGGGEVSVALRQIGLDARELARLAPDKQFDKITAALENVRNGSERARLGNAIFSRDYEQVGKVVTAGRDAFNAAAQEAREFGAVLSSDTARKAELFNDNLGHMSLIARGMGNAMAEAVLPTLVEMGDQFIAAYKSGGFLYALLTSLGAVGIDTAQRIRVLIGEVAALRAELEELEKQPIGSIIDEGDDFTGDEAEALRETIAAKEREIEELKKAVERNVEVPGAKFPRTGGELVGGSPEDDAFFKYQEQLANRIIALDESLLTEEERWQLHYDQQNLIMEDAFARGIISEQQYTKMRDALETQSAYKRVQIEQQASSHLMAMRFNVFQQSAGLLRVLAGENKLAAIAVIGIEKGLAIAQTIMNTEVAAMRALAELGPIAGPPAAAAIKTMGSISVGLIAAQGLLEAANVGGGGAAAGSFANPVYTTAAPSFGSESFGGGFGSESVAAPVVAPPRREINVTFVGSGRYTYEEVVNGIVPLLNEATDNGVDINVRAA